MAVQDRPLDLRTFQDIVDEARRSIPKYCPEWTDHNVSDPGITLIELFAWMTEMILYQVNRVPDEMYERFLDFIGVQRWPPEPALAEMTMYLTAPQNRTVVIPAETEVSTERTDQTEAITFATIADIPVEAPNVIALRAFRQGDGFEDYLPYITSGLIEAPVFNDPPKDGDALYAGFRGNLSGRSLQIWIECAELEGAHVDPRNPPISWEYYSGTDRSWLPVRLLHKSGTGRLHDPDDPDPTAGLNQNGYVNLHIPLDSVVCSVDGTDATWVRVRYVEKDEQFYTTSPRIHRLRAATIGATGLARQAHRVRDEFLGSSDGVPNRVYQLRESPVIRRQARHVIEAKLDDDEAEWLEVDDFSESGEDDRHFVLHYARGEVRFGPAIRGRDGKERRYGATPRRGALLKMREYYSGGGAVGNVGEGTITQLNSTRPGVAAVINYRPAAGGRNHESLDEVHLRSLALLKRTATAVTREDFERISEEVDGVGRAHCISPQDEPQLAAGSVRLLLLPRLPIGGEELLPEDLMPAPELIRSVSAYLDERKSMGTFVDYGAVPFTWVELDANVHVRLDYDARTTQDERDAILKLKEATLSSRIREFLHPSEGGPPGRRWAFGGAVTVSQIAALLQAQPGVVFVERLWLRPRDAKGEFSRIAAPPHGLIVLADCKVSADEAQDA